jgi:hypothetical protein
MKTKLQHREAGNTLIVVMSTILIVSIIAGTVLMACNTRYNTTSKQIKGWKEALYAAEAGGDVAFNEVRKSVAGVIAGGGTPFTGTGWTTVDATHWTYTLPAGIGDSGSLTTTVAVDNFTTTAAGDAVYRIRSTGTARVFGLRRTGMNDGSSNIGTNFAAGNTRGDGDSLIRKIDFNYDHFIATYGDGDGNNLHQVAVPTDASGNPLAQVSRRIELIAVPVMPIEGAIKALTGYNGNGADSYDSKNGAYPGTSNPPMPLLLDAHDGSVSTGDSSKPSGYVWGDLSTNGGNATSANASGVIDNNQPLSIPPFVLPSHPAYQPGTAANFTPVAAADYTTAPWYFFNSLNNGTINNPSGSAETYVNVVVNGNVTNKITVAKGVNVRLYFQGNFSMKASDVNNNNVDGSPSTNPSRAGHLQLFGISPTAPATQAINIDPPGALYAAIYAPGANFTLNGNPDLYGCIVCKSWSGNGNTTFHFDKQLAAKVKGIDYRIASYIEDVR